MRKVVTLLVGVAAVALVLRRRGRRSPVTIWFSDGSAISLQNREAAEIVEQAEDIPVMAREH
jgi:hypothetical protein